MNAADLFATAWQNLLRRKVRTLLTVAGVLIGVAALVLMVSLGLGLQRQVVQLFETEESLRTLTVRRVRSDGGKKGGAGPLPFQFDADMVPIGDEDLEQIRAVPGVRLAFPELNMFLRVAVDGRPGGTFYPVDGVPREEEALYAKYLVSGKFWSDPSKKECLLPTAFLELRLNGMKPEEALGKKVTFQALLKQEGAEGEEDAYTVAGVIDTEGFGFQGRQIFLPLERALDLHGRKGGNPFMGVSKGRYLAAEVKVLDPRKSSEVAARLRSAGFSVMSPADIVKQINLVFLILEGFMACVGVIGLVVSLFGIANTMAMAVLERTREIGIMKALGARNRDLGRLFLAEAGLLGLTGGLAGLALGAAAGWILNLAAHGVTELPAKVSLFYIPGWLAAGSVLFATLVSMAAGGLPARRAARLEPVAALRYE